MKTQTTETTKTNQTVTIATTIKDDNGASIVKMSATVNSSVPFGNNSMVILNKSLFEDHKEEIRKLYLSFQEEVSCTNIESEDKTVEKDGEVTINNPDTIPSEDTEEVSKDEN